MCETNTRTLCTPGAQVPRLMYTVWVKHSHGCKTIRGKGIIASNSRDMTITIHTCMYKLYIYLYWYVLTHKLNSNVHIEKLVCINCTCVCGSHTALL